MLKPSVAIAATRVSAGSTDELDHVVQLVLSRFLAGTRAKNPVATNRLCRGLALAGREAVPGVDAAVPFPELRPGPWPTADPTFRRRQITQADVVELYEEADHQRGAEAALEPDLVADFIPTELWPLVRLVVVEGPEAAAQRFERAVRTFARTKVPGDRNGPARMPALASVKDMHATLSRLLRTITEVRKRTAAPSLERWLAVPALRLPRVERGGRDTKAPRLELVRDAFRRLDEECAAKLKIRPGEDEIAAMERMPESVLGTSRLFRPLRDRAALILVVITGGRVNAIGQLMRSDFVCDHEGVAPDHRGGAAILLRPGKSVPEDLVRPKVIPEGMAEKLDSYLRFVELAHPRAAKRAMEHRPEHGVKRTTLPDDFPLLLSDLVNFRAFKGSGVRLMLSGKLPDGRQKSKPALIRRDHGVNPEVPEEHRDNVGYHPNAYRHLALQTAKRAGEIWNAEHPASGGATNPEPGLYSDALLDHQIGSTRERLRVLYGDQNTEAARELLAGRAISVMWELLTTDRGSRRRPDVRAISRQAAELRAVEQALQRCAEAFDLAHNRPRLALPPKHVWSEPRPGASAEEWHRQLHRQNVAFSESQDLLHERVDRAEAAVRELLSLAEASSRLREEKEAGLLRLAGLVYDQREWEIVSDSEPPGAEHVDIDVEALLRGESILPAQLQAPQADHVRDWLLIVEFAWACGNRTRSTVLRWVDGKHLPRRPEHRPWEPDLIPLDESLGRNLRRIWIPGVKDSFWPTPSSRLRVSELLCRWPSRAGWSKGEEPTARSLQPLQLPPGVRAAAAEEGSS